MKKILFSAFAMVALGFASCGNNTPAEESVELPAPVKVSLNSSSTSGEFMNNLSPYLDSLELKVTAINGDTFDLDVMSTLRSEQALNIKSVISAQLELSYRDSTDKTVDLPLFDLDLSQNDSIVALVKAGEGLKAKKSFIYKGKVAKDQYEAFINSKTHFIILKGVKLEKAE